MEREERNRRKIKGRHAYREREQDSCVTYILCICIFCEKKARESSIYVNKTMGQKEPIVFFCELLLAHCPKINAHIQLYEESIILNFTRNIENKYIVKIYSIHYLMIFIIQYKY